jgi:hypothetical protein
MPPSQPRGAPPINEGTITGGVYGGIITALCFGAVLLINALYKNRREDRAEKHTADEAVIARQERRITDLEHALEEYQRLMTRTMEDHQGIVGRIVERHTATREENAELRSYGTMLRDLVQRCRDSCEMGRKWGPVPPVPPPRPRPPEDVAFLAKTAAQDVELARGVDERLRRKGPPDHRGSGT